MPIMSSSARLPIISLNGIFNPVYLLAPPLLLLISIPLAIFAVFTTSIAFTALIIRASIVYFELGVGLIRSWLFAKTSTYGIKPPLSTSTSGQTSPTRARGTRRSSLTSTSSSQDVTPGQRLGYKSGSFASLIGTGTPNRDFEGVGGWKEPGEDDEEALWIGMNSRLELPAVVPNPRRKHQRSLTGGNQRWSWSPEAVRISPMQSRARTPIHSRTPSNGPDEYFPPQPLYRKYNSNSDLAGKYNQDGRQRSVRESNSSVELRVGVVGKYVGD